MLNKVMTEEVIKGFIDDYQKIKDEFKEMLQSEGYWWDKSYNRRNMSGFEGVWINVITRTSLRIRWGVIGRSAILYVENEIEDEVKKKILKYLDSYELVIGIRYPNEDFDILNERGQMIKQAKMKNEKRKKKGGGTEEKDKNEVWCCFEVSKERIKQVAKEEGIDIEELDLEDGLCRIKKTIEENVNINEIIELALKNAKLKEEIITKENNEIPVDNEEE